MEASAGTLIHYSSTRTTITILRGVVENVISIARQLGPVAHLLACQFALLAVQPSMRRRSPQTTPGRLPWQYRSSRSACIIIGGSGLPDAFRVIAAESVACQSARPRDSHPGAGKRSRSRQRSTKVPFLSIVFDYKRARVSK